MAANAANSLALETSLSKIRHHTASKLANQRAPAQLLSAIESTLRDASGTSRDGGQTTPTAYLMALIAMLEKAAATTSNGSKADAKSTSTLLPSTLYLLTLVAPHIAPGVLRAQLSTLIEPLADVLSATAVPLGEADSQAALLRSAMGILEPLLLALATDRATLSTDLQLRGCWNATLRLCLDARPKVRKRAQELVGRVLQTDAPPTLKPHPFAAKTAEWATSALTDVAVAGGVTGQKQSSQAAPPVYDVKLGRAKQPELAAAARQKHIDGGNVNSGIWICGFLRTLAPVLPAKSIPALTTNLLRVISQKNPFLSTAAFEVFESLFKIYRPTSESHPSSLEPRPSTSSPRAVNADALIATLDALCSTSVMPSNTDVQLVPPYLRAVENAMVAFARVDDGKPAWKRFASLWTQISTLAFSSGSKASRDATIVRQAGRDAMCSMVRYCLPDAAIEQALQANEKGKLANDPLGKIIVFFEQAFDKQALRYSHAWPELFGVLTALVLRLRYRKTTSVVDGRRPNPAATALLMPLVGTVGQLRSQPKFEHREQADAVIGAAVQVCGPADVLERLPLGLLGENGQEKGRAWLLPLMRTHISNTNLSHFVNTMVPLSEALFNKQAECEQVNEHGKAQAPVQAKLYEAMTEQIWALLPGYCDVPIDMLEALSQTFVELLANVLYSQPSLRPSVCRALQVLVERSQSLAKSAAPPATLQDTFGLTAEQGRLYVTHLTAVAPTLLAVFFNVFSQSLGEARGYLAECMVAYLGIMTHDEIGKTYEKIVRTLDESLPALDGVKAVASNGPKGVPPIPHTMMDLLILLVPFLTQREADKLFDLGCEDRLLACRDASMQKKTYRVLARLMEGPRGAQVLGVGPEQAGKLPVVLAKLQATTGTVVVGAKRDRTALLASIVPLIPSSELHILPAIVPEAVLATKEVNQGARELAYTLLVEMGRKMNAGGTIKRHLVDGTNEEAAAAAAAEGDAAMITDSSSTVTANVQEYITMVAAGLAGTSPHMISATITALARLMYEFHDELPRETLNDVVSTMDVFLGSPNREVAKSALGFVKVAIVSLPTEVVDLNLQTIVHALFSSTNHHRMHFKSKIRHIIERLLRRFGYDRISAMTDEENRKLLVNIRKRKERSRRKKAAKEDGIDGEEEDGEQAAMAAATTMGQRMLKNVGADAFEEALYGSESDMSDDSDDDGNEGDAASRKPATGGKRAARKGDKRQQAVEQDYLLQDDDQPMDLLDRAALASGGRITAAGGVQPHQGRKRQPGQEAKRFTLDEETGRMVIDDPEAAAHKEDDDAADALDVDGAGRAYLDRERGTHGFVNKDGVVRLNKNNKRNRAADEEMEQEQMALEDQLAALQQEAAAASTTTTADKKRKKQQQQRKTIGSEFRARKAGGDIKRGETSPFAYVPLSQVGGKRGGGKGGDVRFLGKDKKRRM